MMPADEADVFPLIADNPSNKIVFAASEKDGMAQWTIPFDLNDPRDSVHTFDYGGLRLYTVRVR